MLLCHLNSTYITYYHHFTLSLSLMSQILTFCLQDPCFVFLLWFLDSSKIAKIWLRLDIYLYYFVFIYIACVFTGVEVGDWFYCGLFMVTFPSLYLYLFLFCEEVPPSQWQLSVFLHTHSHSHPHTYWDLYLWLIFWSVSLIDAFHIFSKLHLLTVRTNMLVVTLI